MCKVCNSTTIKIFTKKVLDKFDVAYFKCIHCGFIQTEKPYWFKKAYSNAITSVDVGLINRNIQFSDVVENIIYEYFNKYGRFLDFAGGYGIFTRIMRDKGFNFYLEDKYCENLFAKNFNIRDLLEKDRKFELVTAFELMEHIENPFKELDYIFSITDNFLFSTELIPNHNLKNWWYLGTEHGQHISFYTKDCLEKIAKKYDKFYYSNVSLHLITNKKNLKIFKASSLLNVFFNLTKNKIKLSKKLPSRTWQDFEYTKKMEKI